MRWTAADEGEILRDAVGAHGGNRTLLLDLTEQDERRLLLPSPGMTRPRIQEEDEKQIVLPSRRHKTKRPRLEEPFSALTDEATNANGPLPTARTGKWTVAVDSEGPTVTPKLRYVRKSLVVGPLVVGSITMSLIVASLKLADGIDPAIVETYIVI
jgi:hypothetical protein